jgi:hypothetical protein
MLVRDQAPCCKVRPHRAEALADLGFDAPGVVSILVVLRDRGGTRGNQDHADEDEDPAESGSHVDRRCSSLSLSLKNAELIRLRVWNYQTI